MIQHRYKFRSSVIGDIDLIIVHLDGRAFIERIDQIGEKRKEEKEEENRKDSASGSRAACLFTVVNRLSGR